MAVTNYYTVNGKIRGQHVQGDAEGKDYLLDASGNLVGVYQGDYLKADAAYDPFGNILDSWNISFYNFTWAGGHGYRQTGLAFSSAYVRARHYSNMDAAWTTRDPLWPSEMPYGYVEGRVPGSVDPSGMLVKNEKTKTRKTKRCAVYACDVLPGHYFGVQPGHRYTCVQILRKDGSSRYCGIDQGPSNYHVGIIGSAAVVTSQGNNSDECPSTIPGVKCELIVGGENSDQACQFADDMCKCMDEYRSQKHTYRLVGNNCVDLTLLVVGCACRKNGRWYSGLLGDMCRSVTGG